jgi:WD40 repeat protein
LATSGGAEAYLWDAERGEKVLEWKGLTGAGSAIRFTPDGRRLVIGGVGAVRLCDITTGQEVLTFQGFAGVVCSVGFSQDGKRLVAGSAGGSLRIWEAP